MKSRLHILAVILGLLVGASGTRAAPAAQDVGTRLTELAKRFAAVDKAVATRVSLLDRLDRYRRTIRDTRGQEAGPARDFKLRRLLAESRALAKQISAVDADLARHQKALEVTRQALLRHLSALKGTERQKVHRELARTRQAQRPAVLKVARPEIHPLDGPREIEEKADVLKDSEEKIRKRIEEIDQALANLTQRRQLRAISQRVDRYTGIFNEDSSSRRVTRIRSTKVTSPGAGDGTQGLSPSPASEMDGDANASFDDYSSGAIGGRSVTSGTYAVVLRELLTPATLQALRKAGESGDPETRLQALRKAREELRRTAADLHNRSQAFRERARDLRTKEKR